MGHRGAVHSTKALTKPKGRPTRARNARFGRRRVFGPVAQWIAVVMLLVLLFVVLFLLTRGENDNATGVIAPAVAHPSGSLRHPT